YSQRRGRTLSTAPAVHHPHPARPTCHAARLPACRQVDQGPRRARTGHPLLTVRNCEVSYICQRRKRFVHPESSGETGHEAKVRSSWTSVVQFGHAFSIWPGNRKKGWTTGGTPLPVFLY